MASKTKRKRNTVHTEHPVIIASHCLVNDKCTNTLMHNMQPLTKVLRILIERDVNPVLLFLKRQTLGIHFNEQIY